MAKQDEPRLWRLYRKARRPRTTPPVFQSSDPAHAQWLAGEIWGGEYDAPGFVPRRRWRVVDIGANVGAFAALARSRGAEVCAYEPHPETFRHLMANAGARGVDCRHAAVVGVVPESGTLPLFLGERDTHHTLTAHEQVSRAAIEDSVEVPVVSIDEAVAGGCDLLKMDCEGSEYEILEHIDPQALRGVLRMVVELHGDGAQMRAFEQRLRAEGFRLRSLPLEHERLAMCYARRWPRPLRARTLHTASA